jgi:hypothetical protein
MWITCSSKSLVVHASILPLMDLTEHKRASKTEWGYYVRMKWPMCLVYRKDVHKVISVSRKKITCHEGIYANFDPTKSETPNPAAKEIDPDNKVNPLKELDGEDAEDDEIKGGHSVKVLREF